MGGVLLLLRGRLMVGLLRGRLVVVLLRGRLMVGLLRGRLMVVLLLRGQPLEQGNKKAAAVQRAARQDARTQAELRSEARLRIGRREHTVHQRSASACLG